MEFNIILGIALGIGLSAAAGFRIFVPFLLLNLAYRFDWMELSADFAWMGGDIALALFTTATILEILAYFVPFIDNLLDTIMTPLAVLAGTLLMSSAIIDMDPALKWTIAIIAGGGTAGIVKSGSAATRLLSSGTTGGFGNWLVALTELFGAFFIGIGAILLPLAFACLILILLFWLLKKIYAKRKQLAHSVL